MTGVKYRTAPPASEMATDHLVDEMTGTRTAGNHVETTATARVEMMVATPEGTTINMPPMEAMDYPAKAAAGTRATEALVGTMVTKLGSTATMVPPAATIEGTVATKHPTRTTEVRMTTVAAAGSLPPDTGRSVRKRGTSTWPKPRDA